MNFTDALTKLHIPNILCGYRRDPMAILCRVVPKSPKGEGYGHLYHRVFPYDFDLYGGGRHCI